MTSETSRTFRLKNGEVLTLSPNEFSHPDFQLGWKLAEQGKGTLNPPLAVRNLNIFRLGNDAGDAFRRDDSLKTTRSTHGIHALFLRADRPSDTIRTRHDKIRSSIVRYQNGLDRANARLKKLQLECGLEYGHKHQHSQSDNPNGRICEDCGKTWLLPDR